MYNVGDYSGIGAMVDIFQSPTKVSEEQQFEIINNLKPKLLTALNEESFLSVLHKQLDEKSKYMKYNDLVTYHPETPFDYTFKEKAACLVSEWYDEYLASRQIDISSNHKRDYPLTVLLPVILDSIANSQFQYIDSDTEDAKHNVVAPVKSTSDVGQELISYTPCFMFEDLCPVWQGEFNDILHLNTCSIDNIITLVSLHFSRKNRRSYQFCRNFIQSRSKTCF